MNNGPAATIREIVEIPLKRSRSKKNTVHDPKYMEIHDRQLNLLIDKFSIEDYRRRMESCYDFRECCGTDKPFSKDISSINQCAYGP
ncbi:hypothetical protein [Pedobacter ginsengisoli]|uniref:hypothetical protein n=1 Tax=Pedobacter ginsengisoli TaxID=363852 RepID=UPI0025505161|nr:hypothetical protein [Pedobacter ginsengisoli]